ncbi:MAG TPA: serine/threonine-protein kinase [Polyangiaceae bacterium]
MAGEYRLLRKLGEGGFGAVYEAEHPLLKRRAAVKVLHRVAARDSDAALRFISEAQAVNQIRNRHIVDVFSFGQLQDGRHFYVMDLLDGVPLDRWLKLHGRMDVPTTLQLLMPIAEALDLAHAAGIVHRDLKPQNIFLAWDASGETVPKLLDFGMAKLLGDSPVHTVSGTPIGTPLYMSPEQARGERVDQRSDVYALGVLAYELLVGQLPFTGDTTVAVLMAHIIQVPVKPSEAAPQLSPLLDAPILSMLEKDPEKRPAAAGAALRALASAAQEAGIALATVPLHLPKPEQPLTSEPPEGPDTWLDEASTTGSMASDGRSSASGRPLWPFGVALLVLGVVLGVVVLRPAPGAAPAAEVAAPSATTAPSPAAAVDAVSVPAVASPSASPSSVAASSAPSAAASGAPSAAASAPPTSPRRHGDAKRAKPAPASAAAIPGDLENPFR